MPLCQLLASKGQTMSLKPKSNSTPSSNSSKPKASWRSPAGRPESSSKLWSKPRTKEAFVVSRGLKLFISLTLLVGLSLFFILFILRGDKKPTVLVFPITEYSYPWSPNAWVKEDAAFLELAGNESQRFKTIIAENRQGQSWKEWLKSHLENGNFTAGGPGSSIIFPQYQSIAVYLSGHVDIDSNGIPCLLFPQNASSIQATSEEDAWYGVEPVPLDDVLRILVHGMDLAEKNWWSRETHRKLIVLDIGKQVHRLHMGAPSETLHDSIDKVVKSLSDPNLAVIVSHGPNERAWTLPERGGSNFGLHFAHGLSGAANVGAGNDRITLKELVKYLEVQVDQSANGRLGVAQKPLCFYGATDERSFEIAFAGSASSKKPPSSGNSLNLVQTEQIDHAWNEFADWQKSMVALDPWIVSEVRNRLANLECLLVAGPSYSDQLKAELESIDLIVRGSEPVAWPVTVDGQTRVLELERAFDSIDAEVRDKVTAWLDQKLLADGKPLAEPPILDRQSAFASIWHWIEPQRELTPAGWSRAVALFNQSITPKDSLALLTRDVLLFDSLKDGVERSIVEHGNNHDSTQRMVFNIPMFFKTHKELAKLNEIQDPRLCLWHDAQQSIHSKYFDALDFWLLGNDAGLRQCEELLKDLQSSLTKTPLIEVAEDQKRNLELAWTLHDEQSMLLPTFDWVVQHEPSLTEGVRIREDELRNLASDLVKLHNDLVQAPPQGPLIGNDRFKPINDLQTRWKSFQKQILRSAEELADIQVSIEPESRRNMTLWLQQPIDLPGDTRTVIRDKLLKHLSAESMTTPTTVESSANDTSKVASAKANGSGAAATNAFDLAWWQAMSVERSAGESVDDSLRDLDGQGSNASMNRKRSLGVQASLATGISNAVSKFTKDSGKLSEARNEAWRLAWSSRMLAPFIVQTRSRELCGTRHHWAIASQLSMLAMAKQSLDDFWVQPKLPNDPNAKEFYAILTNNFLRQAEDFPRSTKTIEAGLASNALTKSFENTFKDKDTASRTWQRTIWSSVPTAPVEQQTLTLSFNTPAVDAGTILSGNFPDAPIVVSREKPAPQVRVDAAKFGSASPLKAFLRGRSSERTVEVAGVTTEPEARLSLNQPSDAKVRVRSQVSPRQILFVLDCSASFDQADHNQAKSTLLKILSELPEESTEVGLMVFGHSSQWTKADGKSIQKGGRLDPSRTPENDIDLVVSMKPLTKAKGEFEKQLGLVDPHGFTPLFRAIDIGREELVKSKSNKLGYEQHLVVVTDGADNVYTDINGTTVSDVATARRFRFTKSPSSINSELLSSKTKLHIIKFKFSSPIGNISSFAQLVAPQFIYDAENSESLKQAFESILGIRNFSIWKDGSRLSEMRIGNTTPGIPVDRMSKLQIQIGNDREKEEIEARGGDLFDINYDPVNKTFRYLRLDEKLSDQSEVNDPTGDGKSSWRVSVLPEESIGLRTFSRFAIQPGGDNDKIAPKQPAKIWVELKLIPKGASKPRTVFLSTVQWESYRQSPVFRIPIEQAEVTEARVWLSFADTRSESVYWNQWQAKDNVLAKDYMAQPEIVRSGNQWGIKFTPKTSDRIRMVVSAVSSVQGKPPALQSLVYTFGSTPTQTYFFNEEPTDLKITYEKMPDEDRPNSNGWMTSKWLKIDGP
jgi:hypothetical protein